METQIDVPPSTDQKRAIPKFYDLNAVPEGVDPSFPYFVDRVDATSTGLKSVFEVLKAKIDEDENYFHNITGALFKDGKVAYSMENPSHEDIIDAEAEDKSIATAFFKLIYDHKSKDRDRYFWLAALNIEEENKLVRFLGTSQMLDKTGLSINLMDDLFLSHDQAKKIWDGTAGDYYRKMVIQKKIG